TQDVEALIYGKTTHEIPINTSPYSGFGEDFRKGGDQAAVVLTEFADFQCPACASFAPTLETLHKDFGDRILIVYKNYPLDTTCNPQLSNQIHEFACDMAVAARCAGQYEKFWQFHDLAFARQSSVSSEA